MTNLCGIINMLTFNKHFSIDTPVDCGINIPGNEWTHPYHDHICTFGIKTWLFILFFLHQAMNRKFFFFLFLSSSRREILSCHLLFVSFDACSDIWRFHKMRMCHIEKNSLWDRINTLPWSFIRYLIPTIKPHRNIFKKTRNWCVYRLIGKWVRHICWRPIYRSTCDWTSLPG